MSATGQSRWWGRAFIVGAVLAVALVPIVLVTTAFPRGQKSLGLDATFSVMPTGEIALDPGKLATGANMRPGDEIRGERTVRNQTGRVLTVSVRALPSNHDADRKLVARLVVDGLPLFEGTLGELREWTPRWFQLKRREKRRITLFAELPADAGRGGEGVVVDVPLELKAVPRFAR